MNALLCLFLAAGCVNLEQAIRHEQEAQVRKIVQQAVPAAVDEYVGSNAMRIGAWLLGPTGLLAGAGAMAVHKRKQQAKQ